MALWNTRPLIFGHRGASIEKAENTMASFARAVEVGAHALEMDVHTNADGVIVVAHDDDLMRMGKSPLLIRQSKYNDLRNIDVGGGSIPTLHEVLDAFAHVAINIDIKQRYPRMEKTLVDLLAQRGDSSRVLLTSFFDDVIARVRVLGHAGPTGLGRTEIAMLYSLPAFVLRQRFSHRSARVQVPVCASPAGIGSKIRFDTRTFIDKCHALGLAVDHWVINDIDVAKSLIAAGTDGIMTDDPRKIVEGIAS